MKAAARRGLSLGFETRLLFHFGWVASGLHVLRQGATKQTCSLIEGRCIVNGQVGSAINKLRLVRRPSGCRPVPWRGLPPAAGQRSASCCAVRSGSPQIPDGVRAISGVGVHVDCRIRDSKAAYLFCVHVRGHTLETFSHIRTGGQFINRKARPSLPGFGDASPPSLPAAERRRCMPMDCLCPVHVRALGRTTETQYRGAGMGLLCTDVSIVDCR